MNKVKKYPAYKDSGIEWIGEIPEHWEVRKFRYLFSYDKGKKAKNEYNYLQSDFLPYVNMEYVREGSSNTFIDFKKENIVLVNEGDLILLWDGSNAGEFHLSPQGVLASTLSKINLLYNKLDKSFIYFLVKLSETDIKLNTIGMGIPHVSGEYIKNIKFPLPPLSEQKKIASFLDKKTGEIDKAIELKQKENELLKERRQVVINQAVTRGLHPDVTYKDSGIDWIGEIPEHWEIRKLKHIFDYIFTGTTPDLIYFEDNGLLNWFTPGDLNAEKLSDSERKLQKRTPIRRFKKESILIVGIGATSGKTSYSIEEGSTNQQITSFHSAKYNNRFYYFCLKNSSYIFKHTANYTTLPIINNQYFKNYNITLPPLSEQKEIAEYLEELDGKTNRLLELNNQAIAKLKEYKQVVIDQAVRGQICLV